MTARRRALLLALCMVCAALLSACGPKPAPRAEDVHARVRAAQAFADMTEMPQKQLNSYLGLEADWYTDAAASFDVSRYTPEAVVVITARDNAARDMVRQTLQDYRDNLLEEYRTYLPEEMPKIQQAQVRVHGLQVALVISPDDAKAAQALDAAWK